MGDVVGHLLHAADQIFDAVEHGVEVLCKLIKLIAGASDGKRGGRGRRT